MCTAAVHLGLQFYNWRIEVNEQANFPVNAFVFLSIVFGFIFLEQSYEWMVELTCY